MLKTPNYNINTPGQLGADPLISDHFKGISCGLRIKPKGKEIPRREEGPGEWEGRWERPVAPQGDGEGQDRGGGFPPSQDSDELGGGGRRV